MSVVWVTADWHLGHRNIINLCNRPFDTVEEMDDAILGNYRNIVDPGDIVYVLGDVVMGSVNKYVERIRGLPGHKVLVTGNHDKGSVAKYLACGFARVVSDTMLLRTDGAIRLHHFPYDGDSQEDDRYKDMRPEPNGEHILFHGHIHNKWKVNGNQVNVGVDVWDFYPVTVDQAIRFWEEQQ